MSPSLLTSTSASASAPPRPARSCILH
jgi:hypothetical protein